MRSRTACIVVVLAGGLLAGCGGSDEDGAPPTNEIGPVHVHGLGINPADQALFLATHTGLYRIAEGASDASPVGDDRQDTMAFTVVGADHFLGSGHPDPRTDLPPFLGLIESRSAGEEWEPISLLGEADFHVIEAAGERVYGFGLDFETRREQFLVSDDGGASWQRRQVPESLVSLAIDPEDPDRIMASARRSLFGSEDGGRSWQPLPGEAGLLAWPVSEARILVDGSGTVLASDATGSSWREVGSLGEAPAAFEASSATDLYAAMHDGTILQSGDGGRTWETRSRP